MSGIDTPFMPDSVGGTTYQYSARRSPIATIFAIGLMVISIFATLAVWYLESQENAKLTDLRTALMSKEKSFSMTRINDLHQLDTRLSLAKTMFDNHPMPSVLIDWLAENTVASLKWKSFSYAHGAGDAKGDTLSMSGESTNGYVALYSQMMHFRTMGYPVTSFSLDGYHIDPRTNVVSLSMKLTLNPNFATFATVRARALGGKQDVVSGTSDLVPDSSQVSPPIAPAAPMAPITNSAAPANPSKATVAPQPFIPGMGATAVKSSSTPTKTPIVTPTVTPQGN